ncbi:pyridoxamine 5'-phosphate oxidase family protein [Candidatus Enterococcus ferrettii]|uniref:Pyridoxamine 5'-phosphate oxidase N-terminal domain-containing protein n=1 Tax=Candidatus Enterococcus ferrettii TaxID=2815324 RepID=A0ABV0EK32_9ENTE|nr:pyridoxamine 5'-phosphate oxidase family protein [Enterococcus sp. 665A]MBO1338336.1 pyridoxamine 5'-phosphate oxidase family protein [Enterococcus sp. 665A]
MQQVIKGLMQEQGICYLGSITEAGYPMIRAMLQPIKIEGNSYYLHTNTSSNKVQQLIKNEKACLYVCNPATFEGVTLLGQMKVLISDEDKQPFWKEEYQIYYAKGEGLSDFTVLKFEASSGEYYQNFSVQTFDY